MSAGPAGLLPGGGKARAFFERFHIRLRAFLDLLNRLHGLLYEGLIFVGVCCVKESKSQRKSTEREIVD